MTVGLKHNMESSGSVRFVQSDSSVRFGFRRQTLWVCSVRFGMASEWGSSSVCPGSDSVQFPSLASCRAADLPSDRPVMQSRLLRWCVRNRNQRRVYGLRGDAVVPRTWAAGRRHTVRSAGWHLGHRLRLRRTPYQSTSVAGRLRRRSALPH